MNERLQSVINKIGGLTPERHAKKLQQFELLAQEETTSRRSGDKSYTPHDDQSVLESYRAGVGALGPLAIGPLGLDIFITSLQNGNGPQAAGGALLVALSARLTRALVRGVDNLNILAEAESNELDRLIHPENTWQVAELSTGELAALNEGLGDLAAGRVRTINRSE